MPARPTIDARKLWGAGLAASAVGVLAALVVYLLANGVFDTDLYVPDGLGSDVYRELGIAPVVIVAFLAGIVATGVLHLFLLYVPRPTFFFGWLATAGIAVAVLYPFTFDVEDRVEYWLAGLHAATGVAIVALLLGTVPWVKRVPMRVEY